MWYKQAANYCPPSFVLLQIDQRNNTGEALEHLIGVCLQAIIEKHGSGLEGAQLADQFNQILAMVSSSSQIDRYDVLSRLRAISQKGAGGVTMSMESIVESDMAGGCTDCLGISDTFANLDF